MIIYARDPTINDSARRIVAVLSHVAGVGRLCSSFVTFGADDDGQRGSVRLTTRRAELLEGIEHLRKLLLKHKIVLAL